MSRPPNRPLRARARSVVLALTLVASAVAAQDEEALRVGQGAPKWPVLLEDEERDEGRIPLMSPNRPCQWTYSGLGRFKNAARDEGFDAAFNPRITVSRRGLTARVVGTLSDAFVAAAGGSLDAVRERFPWIIPVEQTAIHRVRAEDFSVAARRRERRGEILTTEVVSLPENSVMLVYPVSIAKRRAGFNTLAGNWRLEAKVMVAPNTKKGRFGRFPFLKYTVNGHAFHGPITRNELAWELLRGEVSHGCNRMEGEHVMELAALVGCEANEAGSACPKVASGVADDESVTVMEEFDHVPDPERRVSNGIVTSWDEIDEDWIGVDVDYPRQTPIEASLVAPWAGTGGGFLLLTPELADRTPRSEGRPVVRRVVHRTWDNREHALVSYLHCY